jgi:hypothetical protein
MKRRRSTRQSWAARELDHLGRETGEAARGAGRAVADGPNWWLLGGVGVVFAIWYTLNSSSLSVPNLVPPST